MHAYHIINFEVLQTFFYHVQNFYSLLIDILNTVDELKIIILILNGWHKKSNFEIR